MCHPYISGVSNLNFIKDLASQAIYIDHQDKEYLPEDGWRYRLEKYSLELISPKEWYMYYLSSYKGIGLEEATKLVSQLVNLCQIASSSSKQEVIKAAIKRRLETIDEF